MGLDPNNVLKYPLLFDCEAFGYVSLYLSETLMYIPVMISLLYSPFDYICFMVNQNTGGSELEWTRTHNKFFSEIDHSIAGYKKSFDFSRSRRLFKISKKEHKIIGNYSVFAFGCSDLGQFF